MDITSVIIGFVTGLALAVLVGGVFFVRAVAAKTKLAAELDAERAARDNMQAVFSVTAQEVMDKNSERFLQLAQEKMKQAQSDNAHDFEKRQKAIAELVDPIGKTLKDMNDKVENLGKTGVGLEAQLKTFAEDQKLLREETQHLVRALRNPAARGRWGEMQLQRALEMIGMIEGTHFTQQEKVAADGSRKQPDFIIRLPGDMQIIIDVKSPVEAYWETLEAADSEAGQKDAIEKFRRKVRDHLKTLSSKEYWRHFDTPEFVVMFLPTEGLYSMAVSNDPALIEEAARNNIVLASPTTLMGLLRIVKHGWQQQQMAEEAKTISALAVELYNRIGKFGDHMRRVGSGLGTALNAYNQAIGSLERSVLPGARKFKELHVQTGGKDIDELTQIDNIPRALSAPELASDTDDDDNVADDDNSDEKKTATKT